MKSLATTLSAFALLATTASAHPGHTHVFGSGHGLADTFAGWAILLSVLAVGFWAIRRTGGHKINR